MINQQASKQQLQGITERCAFGSPLHALHDCRFRASVKLSVRALSCFFQSCSWRIPKRTAFSRGGQMERIRQRAG